MIVEVTLKDKSTNEINKNIVRDVENKNSFSYADSKQISCKIDVFSDGIILSRKANDYEIELNLRKNSYTRVITSEGELKIDTKVVDFIQNDDNIVVHYLIGEEDKEITINYRS